MSTVLFDVFVEFDAEIARRRQAVCFSWGGFLGSERTDEALVAEAQAGNPAALDELTSRYFPKKRSGGSGYLGADDLAQESMFGFLHAVDEYDPSRGVPFGAYARVCMDNSRKTAANHGGSEIPCEPDAKDLTPDGVAPDTLATVLVRAKLSGVLAACETDLTVVEKSVVYLHVIGLSYKEIGERLSMDEKAVDNALQRARRKLKKVLADL